MARNPKPTNVHQLNGNPGKRARGVNEPQPDYLEKERADYLRDKYLITQEAKDFWDDFYPEYRAARMISTVDFPVFLQYCEALGQWLRMVKKLEDVMVGGKMPVIVSAKGGFQMHPANTLRKQAREEAERLGDRIGDNAMARTRIQIAERQMDIFDGMDSVVIPISALHGQGKTNIPANNAS